MNTIVLLILFFSLLVSFRTFSIILLYECLMLAVYCIGPGDASNGYGLSNYLCASFLKCRSPVGGPKISCSSRTTVFVIVIMGSGRLLVGLLCLRGPGSDRRGRTSWW